jgi:transposase
MTYILGIDIAKKTFTAALYQQQQLLAEGEFANEPEGLKALRKWLKKKRVTQLWSCMEATGRYGDQLADFLHQQGHQVSVVNPARIAKYAASKLQRHKNDQLDARLIADFCLTQKPDLWSPPPPEVKALLEMSRQLSSLKEELARQKNRLQAGFTNDTVVQSINDHLAFLQQQIDALHQQIHDHIDQHPDLRRQKDLLTSIPGIGDITASIWMAEISDITRFDTAAQLTAFVGLSPSQRLSGTSVRGKPHLSKVGRASLRSALYFPALAAKRSDEAFQAFADRLANKGKKKMVVIGAVMRKLVRVIFGVLKSQTPYDPHLAVNLQVAT